MVLSLLTSGCGHTEAVNFYGPKVAARRTASYQAQLDRSIDGWLKAQDPQLHLGVQVVAMNGREVIYDRKGRERFVPGSTAKVLTAATALSVLGPAYRFPTQLLIDGYDDKNASARAVYLRGSGDPTLEVADLAGLASALRQAGIREVTAEIVIDDTDFDSMPWAQGWMWDDLDQGFSAPVWGLNVAGNALTVWLSPGFAKNLPGRVLRVPEAQGYATIINSSVTVARGPQTGKIGEPEQEGSLVGPPASGANPLMQAPQSFALAPQQVIQVTGAVPLDSSPRARAFAIRDPVEWAGSLFRAELRRQQVQVPATLRRGTVPATAVAVALHESQALGVLLPQFVKASNNHAMECLLKRISVAAYGAPGSFAGGTQAVRRYLADTLGVDSSGMRLADGSGLSRYDLVTPAQLAQTLCAQAQQLAIGPEAVASLPVAGLDGTLMRRFVGSPLQGRVRAKTGTMTGVSSLAGLVTTLDNEQLCFAIMMDNALATSDALRALQDNIVGLIAQRPL